MRTSRKKRSTTTRLMRRRTRKRSRLSSQIPDETVFIDNLPNDEFEIRRMLKEVRETRKALEKQFFEEEDSEKEDELKQISNVAKHEEALAAFKEHSHLK
jgi:hypothetical protein